MSKSKRSPHDIESIGRNFQVEGNFIRAVPYGNGHINDTYLATYNQTRAALRYIHQRVNDDVFKQPVAVMENINQVTTHIANKLRAFGAEDISRRVLTLVPARDGALYTHDDEGNLWRTYKFIDNTTTYDIIKNTPQAFEVGRAFGEFQKLLIDLPLTSLHETISDFHHTRRRFNALQQAIAADNRNRAARAKAEIAFALAREPMVDILLDLHASGQIPTRVIHNDTKMNNLLIDDATLQGICVTDLDTTMPGLALYDFGDMVRTATNSAPEDELDLRKVAVQMDIFKALVRGYLRAADFLNPVEREYLAFSGKLITFEIGIRFLTDYLRGDVYFKTSRSEHNLERCRTQFKLVASIEEQEDEMRQFVADVGNV